jgi:hypothetical protein
MKRTITTLILALSLLIGFQLMVAAQAGAEPLNFKLVSMIDKVERVKISQTEGTIIGVMDRRGLSIFENGEVAPASCTGTFDTKKGFQGYSSIIFEDGSTLVLSWKGPTSVSRPPGGKFLIYSADFECAEGTGRFKGVKGSGTLTGKEVQWDDEYKAMGFALYEFAGTYTLPSE